MKKKDSCKYEISGTNKFYEMNKWQMIIINESNMFNSANSKLLRWINEKESTNTTYMEISHWNPFVQLT
jgi:hypothetical protein